MNERIHLYDTTLRDGAQTQGISFSTTDKNRIAVDLDHLGIDYIEGGWPGANPTDTAFFAAPPKLKRAKFCAFGMTRRAGRSAANDPGLQPLVQANIDAVTLVGKSSRRHAETALGVDGDENLKMIADSVALCAERVGEAMLDAEHFFDGYKEDPGFALACLQAAIEAGARWVVLCDTNGGTLPHEVATAIDRIAGLIDHQKIGIHAHNDTENAVANSLVAIDSGARQIQGTLNGLGERCGNANLISLIPTLKLKLGYDIGITDAALSELTSLSRGFDERLNRTPNRSAAYVGANAFAHKGGLHASAVAKDPSLYEHVDPSIIGNRRDILVSNQAGRANLAIRLDDMGISCTKAQMTELLETVKQREAVGYSYEGATASLELLVRRTLHAVEDFFELLSFRCIDERRYNAKKELITLSEATIKVIVDGQSIYTVAEGNGPINALDTALRQALVKNYPALEHMALLDYKVRILTPEAGTAAVTRVIIESGDAEGRIWQTVGVSGNVIDASFNALHDAITYKLADNGARQA